MYFIPSIINKALRELECSRVVVAKLHSSVPTNFYPDLFSVYFEALDKNTFSIKDIVVNKPISILNVEFEDDLDKISINLYKDNDKCVKHLKNVDCILMINQLLHYNNIVWGVLSFQYKATPFYLNSDEILASYLNKMKQCKQSIYDSLKLNDEYTY